jgi:hypothetical protein
MYAALLGKAPACRLRGHEGLGHEEEQVARARDGEMHVDSSGELGSPPCVGYAPVIARRLPKSACDDLLSQLTAGNQVSGIVTRWMMRARNESDEGDVTAFRRDDSGPSLYVRGRKMLIWSEAGVMRGFNQAWPLTE